MTALAHCPRCIVPGFEECLPTDDYYCPLCGFARYITPALAGAYRLLADTRSLDFSDVMEIRAMHMRRQNSPSNAPAEKDDQ